MATRTIVTSQPDVACYVCERRLLRGEQPEVFLTGGRSRTVCELCAPRAANAGWPRETDDDSVSLPPLRTRRGRNLFDRLRQVGKGADAPVDAAARSSARSRRSDRYDFLSGTSAVAVEPRSVPLEDRVESAAAAGRVPVATDELPASALSAATPVQAAPSAAMADGSPSDLLQHGIEVFNVSEHPRRVAGLVRSLGLPIVSVLEVEGIPNVVAIVVAWELCWYRYRVDFDEQPVEARVLAQGTELAELGHDEQLANALVDELGALSLAGPAPSAGTYGARA